MNINQFVNLHRDDWKQLEDLVSTLHKKKSGVTGATIDQFYRFYQKAAQNLIVCANVFSKRRSNALFKWTCVEIT